MKRLITRLIAGCMLIVGAHAMNAGTFNTNYCLSDEETVNYLNNYLGLYDNGNGYQFTEVVPSATAAGDVLFVEVNDYWIGATGNPTEGTEYSSYFDQIKYGVTRMVKVPSAAKIPTGELYKLDASTNRFFFISRRDTRKTKWDNTKYKMPFSWYNEWSCIKHATSDNWNSLTESYAALKDGEPMQVPHICDNSLEMNHFTTLYDKDTKGEKYTLSLIFYLPDNVEESENYISSINKPYMFIYTCKLSGELEKSNTSVSGFNANLLITSILDSQNADVKNTSFYDTATGGVKEFFTISRTINGNTEEIAKDVTDKNYVDTTLPKVTDKYGYDVEYVVKSELKLVDASGNLVLSPSGSEMVIARVFTNTVKLHVPGEESFILSINADNKANYQNIAQLNNNKNNFENTVIADSIENVSPALKAGDVISLYRVSDKMTEPLLLMETTIKSVNRAGKYTCSQQKRDPAGTYKELTATGKQKNLLKISSLYTDTYSETAGEVENNRYHLILTRNNIDYGSNYAVVPMYTTDVSSIRYHRSGTPDPEHNSSTELQNIEVSFAPVNDANVNYYYIWRNNSRAARLEEVSNNKYKVLLPADDGTFNQEGGYAPVVDGNVVFTDLISDAPVNKYEPGTEIVPDRNYDYTVEIHTLSDNTYGNNDVRNTYKGLWNELVLSLSAAGFQDLNNPTHYRAELTWTQQYKTDDISDITGYDIYARNEYGNDITYRKINTEKLSPNTNFYNTETFIISNYDGGTAFPLTFYVKALVNTNDPTAPVNKTEKNSNPIRGSFITTGFENINTDNINIYGEPGAIHIIGCEDQAVEVYDSMGRMMASIKNVSNNETIELPAGLYLVKAGTHTSKILVK